MYGSSHIQTILIILREMAIESQGLGRFNYTAYKNKLLATQFVPFREDMAKRHLKVAGDLARVIFIEMDLRNTTSIEESVRHSDIVYNLISRDYPTKNFDLEDLHVAGTERIVEAVAKYDIDCYVQVSSHSASLDSPSEFYRTKARGEQVARSIYPETTIV
jgi:NADH dehydrogenase (ubiquinone) 1 alpha subcomplex subunit 9